MIKYRHNIHLTIMNQIIFPIGLWTMASMFLWLSYADFIFFIFSSKIIFDYTNYVFGSQHDALSVSFIYILAKCFLDIDHSIFQNKVIESIIREDTKTPESGCGSSSSIKEVNIQDLRLDVEDKNEVQSVQSLLDRICDSFGQRIHDYGCENGNKVGFCITCSLFSNIAWNVDCTISNFQISMNYRSRKLNRYSWYHIGTRDQILVVTITHAHLK